MPLVYLKDCSVVIDWCDFERIEVNGLRQRHIESINRYV